MIKKDHHYLAQTYLENFADPDGKVWMYRKVDPHKRIQQRPRELASHKHYYRQLKPDGSYDHNSLEDLFSDAESKWPSIVGRITRRENINSSLDDLFQIMAIHRIRVPASRDAFESIFAEMVRTTGQRLEREGKLPPKPKILQKYDNIWENLEVSIDPQQSIHAMAYAIRGVGELFAKVGFGALHNNTDLDLLSCDNPVIWFDPTVSDAKLRPYVVNKDGPVVVLFPVSPKVIIYGDTSMYDSFVHHGFGYGELTDRSQVEQMNKQICKFAYDAIFAATDTFSDFVARYADTVPVIQTQCIPVDGGDMMFSQYVFGRRTQKPKWKPRGFTE